MLAPRGRRARRPARSFAQPGGPARTPAAADIEDQPASWRFLPALTCQKTPRSARDVTKAARLGAARAAGRRRHQAHGRRAPPSRQGRRYHRRAADCEHVRAPAQFSRGRGREAVERRASAAIHPCTDARTHPFRVRGLSLVPPRPRDTWRARPRGSNQTVPSRDAAGGGCVWSNLEAQARGGCRGGGGGSI